MTYSSKKIRAGLYEYRGYTIEDMYPHCGNRVWNITPIGEANATDAHNTLADAKSLVDSFWYWHIKFKD